MYERHGTFHEPEKSQKIWRYMDFTKFISLIERSSLFFTRADKFHDPFEGQFSKANLNNTEELSKRLIISKADLENIMSPKGKALRQERNRNVINCWHMNDRESAAMWELYLKSGEGIAVQTTFDNLCKSFKESKETIYIGKVNYIDYDQETMPFGNMFLPFLYKRKCFEHERELRAIHSLPKGEDVSSDNKKLTRFGKYININVDILIENLYVSPIADDWFFELVQLIIENYNIDINVIQSTLYEF